MMAGTRIHPYAVMAGLDPRVSGLTSSGCFHPSAVMPALDAGIPVEPPKPLFPNTVLRRHVDRRVKPGDDGEEGRRFMSHPTVHLHHGRNSCLPIASPEFKPDTRGTGPGMTGQAVHGGRP